MVAQMEGPLEVVDNLSGTPIEIEYIGQEEGCAWDVGLRPPVAEARLQEDHG